MTNAINSFTGDVIQLVQGAKRVSGELSFHEIRPEVLPEFLKAGVIETLAPIMLETPSFIQQVVARVLMEEVDWNLVALSAATDENLN